MTNSIKKSSLVPISFLVLIVACQFTFSRAGGTPVVIWCPHNESSDYDSTYKTTPPPNPLFQLSSEDFERSLSQMRLTKPTILVADELCIEDLKNNKVLSVVTNGSEIHYFPCVHTPDAVFQKVFNDEQMRIIEDLSDDQLNMALKDSDSNACIALAGKQCRYSQTERIKRDTAKENSTEFKIKTDRVILYASTSPTFKAPKSEKSVELPGSKVTATSTRKVNGTLILNIKLSGIENIGDLSLDIFFPVKSRGYYTMEKVNFETNNARDTLFAKKDIYFPYNFSYHCSLNTVFINNTVHLNISDMQVQVDAKNAVFDDAYDCVGFTSIPIWTGIFVTAILALIMIWALTMIMDIRTMDRFDDPKGKTITISAAE
ncbi:uncharacterized protein [Linepithema humile]|uniref:uncharacterized protein n=1 Tax=Linepithema humile TaxID=83485 RepID=UPI00062379F4|nr:PREDICTED: uncharacterized protein LOC105671111 [Linepithema humile]